MDGDEVLERLKKDPATKHIPVVMFTADTKRVKVGECQARGAADCLYKPFTPEELLSKVQEILGRKT
jgi:CheY-like chemotaxis protein